MQAVGAMMLRALHAGHVEGGERLRAELRFREDSAQQKSPKSV